MLDLNYWLGGSAVVSGKGLFIIVELLIILIVDGVEFGLLGFVVNALLFFVVGQMHLGFKVDPGFNGFVASLIGSVGMGIISGVINFALKDRGDDKKRSKD